MRKIASLKKKKLSKLLLTVSLMRLAQGFFRKQKKRVTKGGLRSKVRRVGWKAWRRPNTASG